MMASKMIDLDQTEKEYLTQDFCDLNYAGREVVSAVFEECTFKRCDFSEASFRNCRFTDCTFSLSNLSVANVDYSRFTDVVFHECKAIGIDWTKAAWPSIPLGCPLKFYKSKLNDASFFGLSLNEIEIEDCHARGVDFREGEFCEANFRYTDFLGSLFNGTDLTRADFTEATSYQIDIYRNTIRMAKFSRHEAVSLLDSLEIELVD